MKRNKGIIFILALALVLGSMTTSFAAIDYNQWNSQAGYPSDVVGTQLFTAVKSLMDRKILTGDSDGLFHPDKKINRAEFATIMAKATNTATDLVSLSKQNVFNDLGGYVWAKPYINACANNGLIEGIGGGKFAPGKDVSYAEVITIIIRTKPGATAQIGSMGKWPDNYISYAQMYNMMGDVVVYNWHAPISKGEVAKLVYRNMPKASSGSASITLTADKTAPNAGDAVTFTAAVNGGANLTYAWEIDGVAVAGNSNQITWTATSGSHKIKVSVTSTETGKSSTTSTQTLSLTI